MLSIKCLGIGAAGNKAATDLIEKGVLEEGQVKLINSTLGDIPDNHKEIAIQLSSENAGCGKERGMAKKLAIQALKENLAGELESFFDPQDKLCVIVTSTAGGTGSGSSLIIGKYIQDVVGVKVMIYAFTGFEEDARELKNTIEFFKEVDPGFVVQSTSNKKFLEETSNKLKAEALANEEFCNRVAVVSGKGIVDSVQNIDDTDLYKVITTPGYMDAGFISMEKLKNKDQFNRNIVDFLDDSKSLETDESLKRLAVVMNLQDKFIDYIDHSFTPFKDRFGTPYEVFNHIQNEDELGDCIWFIASGMNMPIEEVNEIYDKYQEETGKVKKSSDSFFEMTKNLLDDEAEDEMFDINDTKSKPSTSKDDFFSNL